MVFLTTKISINYSDHEDMNPFAGTEIHLFSHTTMGNFQLSLIVYTKMFSELIQCAVLPSNSSLYSMGAGLIKMLYIWVLACVLWEPKHNIIAMPMAACVASLPKIAQHLEGHR